MSRISLKTDTLPTVEQQNNSTLQAVDLDKLVREYYSTKTELDELKKTCDKANTTLKTVMSENDIDEYIAGNIKAKRVVAEKVTMNEDKLLTVAYKHGLKDIIRTKEYVDTDALENYLYHNDVSPELASDLANCKTVTEVVSLRMSIVKGK